MTKFVMPEPVAYELSATKYAKGKELFYTEPPALASYIKVTNLHSSDQLRQAVCDALEMAAQKCDDMVLYTGQDCATAILALKDQIKEKV